MINPVGTIKMRWYLKVKKNSIPTINQIGLTANIAIQRITNMSIGIRAFLFTVLTVFSLIQYSHITYSQDASLLPNAKQQFFDSDGNPLSSGTVTTYVPGTDTLKDTWQNAAQTVLNSNPITLDAGGRAVIYGEGTYRQVVKDSLGCCHSVHR
jgi:hypothetical protein